MSGVKSIFKRIDLTQGKPYKVIVLFAIPIILAQLLSSAFSLINALVLKETVGGDSVTAINSTSSISNILFQFAYGVSGGFTILLSESIGKKDYSKLKKTFYNAIYLCIGLGILVCVVGMFVYEELLVLLNVNERFFYKAKDYYQIILISFIFMVLFNFFSNTLRAIGDSFAPLVISFITTIFNIILAFFFTGVIKLDTRGVAFATLIANALGVIISYFYIIKKYDYLHHQKIIEKIDKKICLKMLGLGLPLGIQWSVLFIGSFFQDSSVNRFGDGLATKAISCYTPFVHYISIPFYAMSSAFLSYVGQNYGKGDIKRIKQGLKESMIVDLVVWLIILILGLILINYVPYIFLPKEEIEHIIEGPIIKYYCSTYLLINLPCLFMQGFLTLFRSTLQGIQKTFIPLLSGIGELVARVAICAFIPSLINPSNPLSNESYLGICFSTPLAWFMSMVIMGISVAYYMFSKKTFLN